MRLYAFATNVLLLRSIFCTKFHNCPRCIIPSTLLFSQHQRCLTLVEKTRTNILKLGRSPITSNGATPRYKMRLYAFATNVLLLRSIFCTKFHNCPRCIFPYTLRFSQHQRCLTLVEKTRTILVKSGRSPITSNEATPRF
jgi:hypothetical protein